MRLLPPLLLATSTALMAKGERMPIGASEQRMMGERYIRYLRLAIGCSTALWGRKAVGRNGFEPGIFRLDCWPKPRIRGGANANALVFLYARLTLRALVSASAGLAGADQRDRDDDRPDFP